MMVAVSQSPSLRGSGRFTWSDWGNDPSRQPVSIPFIAGQWSLPLAYDRATDLVTVSQSPSLRGSGRFILPPTPPDPLPQASQSPSLRGSGRFILAGGALGGWLIVSIPFIAGQWSLHSPFFSSFRARSASQSPSLRGSGRFPSPPCGCDGGSAVSQSPSLRGSGRFVQSDGRCRGAYHVSIPFIAGQWSLLVQSDGRCRGAYRLNPLHCGAVVASLKRPPRRTAGGRASQSPSLRGSGRFRGQRSVSPGSSSCLNPLHCGAVVASQTVSCPGEPPTVSQSPSLRGSGRFLYRIEPCARSSKSQSPSLRGSGRFFHSLSAIESIADVSIPFIAGQWSLRRLLFS